MHRVFIKKQIFHQLSFLHVVLCRIFKVQRVEYRRIETSFNRMSEEHLVENLVHQV